MTTEKHLAERVLTLLSSDESGVHRPDPPTHSESALADRYRRHFTPGEPEREREIAETHVRIGLASLERDGRAIRLGDGVWRARRAIEEALR